MVENNELISIIIPVYNVEDYLDKCVASAVEQTYRNLEILLVDDGSTDTSGAKCDLWAEKDARIRVIHKPNGGLSDARNAALDIMKGEYVFCLDSDDYISDTCIEDLYGLIKKYDATIAGGGMSIIDEDHNFVSGTTANLRKPLVLTKEEALQAMLYGKYFSNSAWGKLYKASLFDGIRYPKGKVFEDLYVTHRLILAGETYVFTAARHYIYLLRRSSITGTAGTLDAYKRLDAINAIKLLCEFVDKEAPSASEAARLKLMSESMVCISYLDLNTSEEKAKTLIKDLWANIDGYRLKAIKNRNLDPKFRVLAVSALFGKRFMQKTYKLLVKGK